MPDKPELITIIIPIYKVEKQLRKCIDSIVNQSYKNLEIILVDDGSPDDCPKICDEYAAKDSRIRVFIKKMVAFHQHEMLELKLQPVII